MIMNERFSIRQSLKIPVVLGVGDFQNGDYLWVSNDPMDMHPITKHRVDAHQYFIRQRMIRHDEPLYNGWHILARESGYRRSYSGECDALTDVGWMAWKLIGFRYV